MSCKMPITNANPRGSKSKVTIGSISFSRSVPLIPIKTDKKECSVCRAESWRVIEQIADKESFVGIPSIWIRGGKLVATTGHIWATPYVCSKCGHIDFFTSSQTSRSKHRLNTQYVENEQNPLLKFENCTPSL